MKYRKKPVEIEAMLFNEQSQDEVINWAKGFAHVMPVYDDSGNPAICIPTLEGDMKCCYGDYLIKGVKGELYPCKPDVFAATYDEVFTN